MRVPTHALIGPALVAAALAALAARPAPAEAQVPAQAGQARRPIVAVFAHPDDERVVGPLLSRLARRGARRTSSSPPTAPRACATSPASRPAPSWPPPARGRRAARPTGSAARLHLLGLPDGGLASFATLGRLRAAVAAVIDSVRPAAILTFGPEGGTGHPDHRLVGNVVTQVVQGDARHATVDLLYASLPRSACGPRRRRRPP
jgi:LmbE family N-acetylglucosaminyl deacetylase